MLLWNVFYTHIQGTSNTKLQIQQMKPACADPSWVGWPGKRVGIPTGREEPLPSQLPFPTLSGLSRNQRDSKWLRAQGHMAG